MRDELASRGYWCIRIQSGTLQVKYGPRTHYVHCAEEGTPDFWCCRHDGASAFVEVKKPGEQPNQAQRLWHAKARARGIHVGCFDKISDVVAFMRDLPKPLGSAK
jgi:hypothetical protein